MARTSVFDYVRQVRSEINKITWPSRKETILSTVSVFVMVTIAAIFLYLADQIIAWIVRLIMGLGL